VETLAWPSHSWTLAISASCESALVAVARRELHAKPVHFGADASRAAVFQDDITIDRSGIERPVELPGAVVRHRAEHGAGGIGAVAGERRLFLD
jgi:hypothetical protein